MRCYTVKVGCEEERSLWRAAATLLGIAALLMLFLPGCSFFNPGEGMPGSKCVSAADCDDFDPCTLDECLASRCKSAIELGAVCTTFEPCSEGQCDEDGACKAVPTPGEPCDDGNACTANDSCSDVATCAGDAAAAAGASCSDGNPCTGGDECGTQGECLSGAAVIDPTFCEEVDQCTTGNMCLADGSCSGGDPIVLDEDPCVSCTCDSWAGVSCWTPLTSECPCNIWGKVKFVDVFPDITIRYVDVFPDLEIEMVEHEPDGPGQWQEVDAFEEITIQVVDAFPDLEVMLVTNPSNDCN